MPQYVMAAQSRPDELRAGKIKPSATDLEEDFLLNPTSIFEREDESVTFTEAESVLDEADLYLAYGWANRAIAPFVRKMFLTHSSSLASYPAKKAMLVGLPLRPELFDPKLKQNFVPKLLYVSCGKQGSHLVNSALFPLVPELVKHFTLVHQTGANTQTRDLDKARRVKESLGEFSDRYQFAPYFFAKEAATYLQSAHVVVSRAGAHLTYELSVLQKRTVFVPISWVSHNEQLLNAKEAAKITPAVIIEENDLTSQSLYDAIRQVAKIRRTKKIKIDPLSATRKIVDVSHEYLEN